MAQRFTDEQARFIFNAYFGTRIGHKNMQFAMQNIAYQGNYDQETIALCDEPWADPSIFRYNPADVWR